MGKDPLLFFFFFSLSFFFFLHSPAPGMVPVMDLHCGGSLKLWGKQTIKSKKHVSGQRNWKKDTLWFEACGGCLFVCLFFFLLLCHCFVSRVVPVTWNYVHSKRLKLQEKPCLSRKTTRKRSLWDPESMQELLDHRELEKWIPSFCIQTDTSPRLNP